MRYARGVARARVPARTALVGNPSDGFGGATIALALDELIATVVAEPALTVQLTAGDEDHELGSLEDLIAAAERGEYPHPGPLRLLMAAAKRYADARPALADRGIRLAVADSAVPPGVGLGGSSAIVIGALRALGGLFGDPVPAQELPQLALACEVEELGITAGLQDRVVQSQGGLLFMDFDPEIPGGGRFEPLDPTSLPPLFVAWRADAATDSGAAHAAVRERFEAGEEEVVTTIGEIASLARLALTPLMTRDATGLGVLMERNVELRSRIYELDPRHLELIETARELGAPANYTGSGGAIVGLFRDDDQLDELRAALEGLGCELLVRR